MTGVVSGSLCGSRCGLRRARRNLWWATVQRVFAGVAQLAEQPDTDCDKRHNVAFGYGPHHCIGNSLARLEPRVALPTLFRRLLHVRAAIRVEDVAFRLEMRIYGVLELPVLLQPGPPAAR